MSVLYDKEEEKNMYILRRSIVQIVRSSLMISEL